MANTFNSVTSGSVGTTLTNVYTFIGSTDMSANTEPAKKLVLATANGTFQNGEIIKDSANNRAVVRVSSNTVSNVATIFIICRESSIFYLFNFYGIFIIYFIFN